MGQAIASFFRALLGLNAMRAGQAFGDESSWAFLKTTDIGDAGDLYMRRITILGTPWFSIKLHRIYRPDQQRELHDHPWNFFSVILIGYYIEAVPETCQCDAHRGRHRGRTVQWFNYKPAEGRHSIEYVSRSPVWTLVFCGAPRREWGFWIDGGTTFVPWREYDKLNDA